MKESIVLVHGIDDTAKCLHKMAVFFRSKGFETFEFEYKPNDGSAPMEELAEHLKKFVENKIPAGGKISLVGFSMGGIICRYYIQKLGGDARVKKLLMLSSPHHGTFWAYFLGRHGVKQMRLGSGFLKDLNKDVSAYKNVKFVSVYTPLDLMIVPAQSSRILCGENKMVFVVAHPLMIRSKRVMNILYDYLT